jgi:uncharacterized membrane protein YjgN (DUF898 family)
MKKSESRSLQALRKFHYEITLGSIFAGLLAAITGVVTGNLTAALGFAATTTVILASELIRISFLITDPERGV